MVDQHQSDMKAILEFNLPEDRTDFNIAVKGSDWKHVCWRMDQLLRTNTKYTPDDANEEVIEALQKVRDELHRFMFENNVDLYEVE